MVKVICSPVNSSHTSSKLSNKMPLSPGARSNPMRRDSVPGQPAGSQVSRGSNKDPEPSLPVPGAED
jgi:hypothetical protein